jgi:hypothetical protein
LATLLHLSLHQEAMEGISRFDRVENFHLSKTKTLTTGGHVKLSKFVLLSVVFLFGILGSTAGAGPGSGSDSDWSSSDPNYTGNSQYRYLVRQQLDRQREMQTQMLQDNPYRADRDVDRDLRQYLPGKTNNSGMGPLIDSRIDRSVAQMQPQPQVSADAIKAAADLKSQDQARADKATGQVADAMKWYGGALEYKDRGIFVPKGSSPDPAAKQVSDDGGIVLCAQQPGLTVNGCKQAMQQFVTLAVSDKYKVAMADQTKKYSDANAKSAADMEAQQKQAAEDRAKRQKECDEDFAKNPSAYVAKKNQELVDSARMFYDQAKTFAGKIPEYKNNINQCSQDRVALKNAYSQFSKVKEAQADRCDLRGAGLTHPSYAYGYAAPMNTGMNGLYPPTGLGGLGPAPGSSGYGLGVPMQRLGAGMPTMMPTPPPSRPDVDFYSLQEKLITQAGMPDLMKMENLVTGDYAEVKNTVSTMSAVEVGHLIADAVKSGNVSPSCQQSLKSGGIEINVDRSSPLAENEKRTGDVVIKLGGDIPIYHTTETHAPACDGWYCLSPGAKLDPQVKTETEKVGSYNTSMTFHNDAQVTKTSITTISGCNVAQGDAQTQIVEKNQSPGDPDSVGKEKSELRIYVGQAGTILGMQKTSFLREQLNPNIDPGHPQFEWATDDHADPLQCGSPYELQAYGSPQQMISANYYRALGGMGGAVPNYGYYGLPGGGGYGAGMPTVGYPPRSQSSRSNIVY